MFHRLARAREERFIRCTLRRLARQRVALILRPDNVWVVQGSPPDNRKTEAALSTCLVRGWVDILRDAVPTGAFTHPEELGHEELFTSARPVYRLTEGGWHAINRSHGWVLGTFWVALLTLVATMVGLWIAMGSSGSGYSTEDDHKAAPREASTRAAQFSPDGGFDADPVVGMCVE